MNGSRMVMYVSRIVGAQCTASLPYFYLALLLAVGLLWGCANPMPPSGGPVDRTPPAIVTSTPAADEVNVNVSSLRIQFSEYINPQSFPQAFSITPPMEGRLEFGWRGRAVELDFPEPLRPNTTYVITIDTNLRDANGVALDQPLIFAFSTGPTINQGQLAGRVVDPVSGSGVAGIDVYAYARPDSSAPVVLPERPDYRTQTDPQGRFEFQYLNEQPYFIVAVQDRNRNRLPDPAEPLGVPPVPVVVADTSDTETPGRWFLAATDTTAPIIQRVRPLSERRLEVRFNEPVSLASSSTEGWTLQDSVRNVAIPIHSVYTIPGLPQQVYVLTDALQAQAAYRLRPAGVVDTAANVVHGQFASFTGIAQPDTVQTRFLGFAPEGITAEENVFTLPPGESLGVQFNQPIDTTLLRQAMALVDTSGAPLTYTFDVQDGAAYVLTPAPPVDPGTPLDARVNAQAFSEVDSVYVRTFRSMPPRELGELSGYVAAPDATGTVVVELYASGMDTRMAIQRLPSGETERFLFTSLPEGQGYRLRAFLDQNANDRWDPGQIVPYEPAELLVWSGDSLRVRARWEEELADTLRIPASGY